MSRTHIAILLATVVAGGAVAGLAFGGDDRSRQGAIAQRGSKVMPFSLDATTHIFDATAQGGTQRVVADDPAEAEQIGLIRAHLRKEAAAFRRGNFGDPASIHGKNMPGLKILEDGYERIDVGYRDLRDGAAIAYRTKDLALVGAVRAWFDAQLGDHGSDAKKDVTAADSSHAAHGG